jgi:UDP-2,4-diacetamido-2,4,6-trideoxy-beta-L-altropyranose hydrolase
VPRQPSSVIVRCDAGAGAGLGHVSRCLTLADAFAARNIPVRFVTAEGAGMNGATVIKRRGHPVESAAGPVGAEEDLNALCATLKAEPDPLAVIDGWNAGPAYMNAVMQCAVTMHIHDAPGAAPPAHILVNPHLDAAYGGAAQRQLRLLGPRYNFVRPAFFARPASPKNEFRVVVTFGGEDPHNHSLWALTELDDLLRAHRVDVILGPAHPDPQSVAAAAGGKPNVRIINDPPDMAEWLVGASFAITAGGTTCYELAAAGVPQLAIAVEDHQWPLIRHMVAAGTMIALGDYHGIDNDRARSQVRKLLDDVALRTRLAEAGRRLFSEPGAPCVVAAVFDYYNKTEAQRASRASTA